MRIFKLSLFAVTVFLLTACSRGYEPVNYGNEACAHCRMTIVDDRYAAEMITQKGKVFKFDDIICMRQYLEGQPQEENALFYVEDYLKKKQGAIDATSAFYLQNDFFSSPMNGNYAAFTSEADARLLGDSLKAGTIKWEDIR